jgi:CBS domain-containing protein
MVLYAKDILEKDFLSLSRGASVLEGAKAMKGSRHGFAVIGDPSHPEGIVTEWDILCKVVAEGLDTRKVTLGEIMSTDLTFVDADTGISAVSQLMTQKGVRRLIVKKGDQVVGFITAKTMLARLEEYIDRVSHEISKLQAPWF